MSNPITIPADLARDLESGAYKLSALCGTIDVVHEAGACDSGDKLSTAAKEGLFVLIEVVAQMAAEHARAVDGIFLAARKARPQK